MEHRSLVEKTDVWTRSRAVRLSVNSDAILAAVRRGWLPELLEAVQTRYALESLSPPLDGVYHECDARIAEKARA